MECTNTMEDIPACYLLPNMKEVRANLLWHTQQHGRLQTLRNQVYNSGGLLNYVCPVGVPGKWRLSYL